MLGKLLKHEFKAQYKMYCGVYVAVLLFAGVAALCNLLPKNTVFKTIHNFAIGTTVIGLVAMFVLTLVMSIIRYYTNLIKDQGYLMHTLPVKPFNLHIVKIIVPVVWNVLDAVILILSIMLLTGDWKFEWFETVKPILEMMGVDLSVGSILIMILYMVMGIISSLSMFYACINAGSLSANNKGAMAFVAYIVFYMINQAVSMVGMIIFYAVMLTKSGMGLEEFFSSELPPDGYFSGTFLTSAIIGAIFIVAYNLVSGYIITKKVNLE